MLVGAPFGLGPFELILILAVIVIIFGVGRLPEVGGAIGRGIREFRKATKDEEPPAEISEVSSAGSGESPAAAEPEAPRATSLSCSKCGATNAGDAKFCKECGASIEAPVG